MVNDQVMGGLAQAHLMVTRLYSPPPSPHRELGYEEARNSNSTWSITSLWCNITIPLQGSPYSDNNRDDESELDVSFVRQSADDSL